MLVAEPAHPEPLSDEGAFLTKLNELRSTRGLPGLQLNGSLVGMARGWSQQMASAGTISHNPNLGVQAPSNWQRLGENVGAGPDVQQLHDAFVNSPSHYSNMVDGAFREIGIGVVIRSDGTIFVTVNFMTPQPPPPVASPSAKKSCTRGRRGCKTVKPKPRKKAPQRRTRR
jgi:uncharacterized protein YkwD